MRFVGGTMLFSFPFSLEWGGIYFVMPVVPYAIIFFFRNHFISSHGKLEG